MRCGALLFSLKVSFIIQETWYGRNDSLRIAYVHETKQMIDGKPFSEYYSKLIKADPSGKEQVNGNSTGLI
jgi:hypothetical protein